MAKCLSDDQIDLAINAEMERAGKAFVTLGSMYEPRVTLLTRCGRLRRLWMTTDQRDDAENKLGMARAVLDHEPAALIHTYWRADLDGQGSGIYFAVEVRVSDACAMYVWFTEGFTPKGGGEYAPARDAALVGSISFDECDAVRMPDLSQYWPWTLGTAADWVFASTARTAKRTAS